MCDNVQRVLPHNHAQRQIRGSRISWANIPDTTGALHLPPFAEETSGEHGAIFSHDLGVIVVGFLDLRCVQNIQIGSNRGGRGLARFNSLAGDIAPIPTLETHHCLRQTVTCASYGQYIGKQRAIPSSDNHINVKGTTMWVWEPQLGTDWKSLPKVSGQPHKLEYIMHHISPGYYHHIATTPADTNHITTMHSMARIPHPSPSTPNLCQESDVMALFTSVKKVAHHYTILWILAILVWLRQEISSGNAKSLFSIE